MYRSIRAQGHDMRDYVEQVPPKKMVDDVLMYGTGIVQRFIDEGEPMHVPVSAFYRKPEGDE